MNLATESLLQKRAELILQKDVMIAQFDVIRWLDSI